MKPMALSKSKAERTDPEQEKKRRLMTAVTNYLLLKKQADQIAADMKTAREMVAEMAGVSEATPKCELAGLASVSWVVKQGSRKIDHALLVKVLMEKAGATGEQANKLADLATVQGEGSQYVEIRPAK